MRVVLDKHLDKDVFRIIKTTIGYSSESAWNKISYVNFWKIDTNYEKIDNLAQVVPPFDIKHK